MKKIITLIALFCLIYATKTFACPSFFQGYVIVVDEQNNVLHDAKIYVKYNTNDSVLISKNLWYSRYSDTNKLNDTSYFAFFSGGGIGRRRDPQSYYRVCAYGYADLIVYSIDFSTSKNDKHLFPTIKLTMYRSKKLFIDHELVSFNQYILDEAEAKNDTTTILINDYLKTYKSESKISKANRRAAASMKAYPNPVVDYLEVSLTDSLTLAYKAVITDLNGKFIKETFISEAQTRIEMLYETPGMYFISIYNSSGELKYCLRFVKN